MPGVDTLQFCPVKVPGGGHVLVMRAVVVAAEQSAMAVVVPVAAPQFTPCRYADPCTEGYESGKS